MSNTKDLGLPRLPEVSEYLGIRGEMMETVHVYAVSSNGELLGYATGDLKSIESYFLSSCDVVAVHLTRIKPLHINALRLDRWHKLLAERERIEADLKRINGQMDEFASGQ
jgi:hypothetical protein